ncbi:tetratricopeptide repeat protein [Buchnera aphidicola]|uniref:Protein SirB1 N-terminal domain-containing protein n=1 Tax=Buchnera aphidicola (Anoecia oenotherae) TaxID=1241833 RepID=A0A4D6XXS3_9GAMM|nr:tetratricopeptide repeat protein [Buchnera aphidicola]QCI19274.1 hypothetical protein D9V65_00720 [Buchnera aphidicola (Anoecia oenotherae)]
MLSFSNIDFSKSSLFHTIIDAFKKIDKDFPSSYVLSDLKNKIEEAKIYVSVEVTNELQVKKLLDLFFFRWKFGGAKKKYQLSDMLWMDKVLKTRQGIALSLGILLMHLAKEINLTLTPILFPTQLILKYFHVNKSICFFNPLNGETIDRRTLDMWIKGNISPTSELKKSDLKESTPISILKKLLNTLKTSLIEEKKMELALNTSNVLLEINPNNPYEIRDRGLIYAQLECYNASLQDLNYFIEKCPDDPISELIKIQIHTIEQKKTSFH